MPATQILADIAAQGGEGPPAEPRGGAAAVDVDPAVMDALRAAAVAAFRAGADPTTVRTAVGWARHEARRLDAEARRPAPGEPRPDRRAPCPSGSRYQAHLRAGERCPLCMPFMSDVARERRKGPGATDRVRARWRADGRMP